MYHNKINITPSRYLLVPLYSKVIELAEQGKLLDIVQSEYDAVKKEIELLIESTTNFDWQDFILPLDIITSKLESVTQPIYHLIGTTSNETLNELYNDLTNITMAFSSWFSQNERLYECILSVDVQKFTPVQRRVYDCYDFAFKYGGFKLNEEKRAQLKDLKTRKSNISNEFSQNIVNCNQQLYIAIDDVNLLDGLTQYDLEQLQKNAKEFDAEYVINMSPNSIDAIMRRCNNRDVRLQVLEMSTTRATEHCTFGQYDNTENVKTILDIRSQVSDLLGYDNHAEMTLEHRMAKHPDNVYDLFANFENIKRAAQKELDTLQQFAADNLDIDYQLEAHDISYVSEKYKQQNFGFTSSDISKYFPCDHVLSELENVVQKLWGLKLERCTITPECDDLWTDEHQIQSYRIYQEKTLIGVLQLDLYTRPSKKPGAWMSNAYPRYQQQDGLRLPLSYIVCNFPPPTDTSVSELTMNDVTTLFHEMGHAIHSLVTTQDVPSISGINNVQWDAVELPSQLMENWAWDKQVLTNLTKHVDTNESMPDELMDKLIASQTYMNATHIARQLMYSELDMRIHHDSAFAQDLDSATQSIRDKYIATPSVPNSKPLNSFSHIFAGGYSAGYYSYLWADVLSADAFSLFEENGIFDLDTADGFKRAVLEVGGSVDAADAFKLFRGRDYEIGPLLKQLGIDLS